ncbi:hypothetical protein [Paraferrimonas sp. SM1919]|uniref:hypothetical protein n=1 Tax=Paraferrimonas sp. SM1919 TaxID=2662263 RepID=UPI0013D36475|nr:hypothetical protein [Paraferrimonas sp. SM1919]
MNNNIDDTLVFIAKEFINYTLESTEKWSEAYLRFESEPGARKVEMIYGYDGNGTFYEFNEANDEFTFAIMEPFKHLKELLFKKFEKEFCVCLLKIDSDYNYDFFYEYDDRNKWEISKMNGASGIPNLD